MSRPKNKEEYRQEMAEAFANVLEEKGLEKNGWEPVAVHRTTALQKPATEEAMLFGSAW